MVMQRAWTEQDRAAYLRARDLPADTEIEECRCRCGYDRCHGVACGGDAGVLVMVCGWCGEEFVTMDYYGEEDAL